MLKRLFVTCLFTAAAAVPAMALTDEQSGLTLDLPEDRFVMAKIDAVVPNDVTFSVAPVRDEGNGPETAECQVSFVTIPGNATYEQSQINDFAAITINEMAGQFSAAFSVHSMDLFDHRGIAGQETIGAPQGIDVLRARLVMLTMETPRGRTSVYCAGPTEQLDHLLQVTRAIRDGVTPPR